MDRTPIKIPGKNTRDTSKSAIAARKALNRAPGRPLKLKASVETSRTSAGLYSIAKISRKRTLKNIKSRRKMSELEKLPIELLERVFIYCMNIDLPRSSPVIGGKLSSESIYTKTVIAAFGPTWDLWHACYVRPSAVVAAESNIGDRELQSAILNCRWASLDIMLQIKEIWIRRYALDRIFEPISFLENGEPQIETLDERNPLKMTAAEYLRNDFTLFSTFINQHNEVWPWDSCSWDTYKDLADGVEIPSRLLLGPWTEEATRHLFWLVKAGARIEWLTSTSGEVALAGLKNAISVGDIRVIHLLVWAGLVDKIDTDSLIWALRNVGGDKLSVINHLLSLAFNVLPFAGANKLHKTLTEIRDEAEQASNQEVLAFCMAVFDSQMFQAAIERTR